MSSRSKYTTLLAMYHKWECETIDKEEKLKRVDVELNKYANRLTKLNKAKK